MPDLKSTGLPDLIGTGTPDPCPDTIQDMTTLQERLAEAMAGPPKIKQTALAKACKLTLSSVNDWTRGKTRKIEGANLLAAARYLNVNAEWLASGRGPMRPLNESGMGGENYSRPGQESQQVTLDEDTLHEAITLLLHDEMQAGAYPPRAKTRRLVELYEWVAAEGGRLSAASNREYEYQVFARQQGAGSGRSKEKGPDRG